MRNRRNRQDIAARETRSPPRLRAIERVYRAALDQDAIPAPELTQILPSTETAPGRELASGVRLG